MKRRSLLRLANSLTKKQKNNSTVTAMHLSLSDEHILLTWQKKEKKVLSLFLKSLLLNLKIEAIFKVTNDIETEYRCCKPRRL
jgi:hypothetical protein